MPSRTIEWDRQKLYEQIWAAPLRKVAKEYGISDVGLAKVCKKLQIPRPGVGYWRRKECGYKVSRMPLPKLDGPKPRHVSHIRESEPPKAEETPGPPLPPLKQPRKATTLHPLVRQTKRAYKKGGQDRYGRLHGEWDMRRLDLRVTAAGLERALTLMHNLIRLLEANGMQVSAGSEERSWGTVATVHGEKIRVVLLERVRGRKRPLTPHEKRERERWSFSPRRDFEWAHDPTGRMELTIESWSDGQTKWVDGRGARVEDCMEQIARGLLAAAAYQKRRRAEEAARREREWQEMRLRMREEDRIRRLKENVARWEEAQRIRSYLAAVKEKAEARKGGPIETGRIRNFLTWAHRYADRLDPAGAPASQEWGGEEP